MTSAAEHPTFPAGIAEQAPARRPVPAAPAARAAGSAPAATAARPAPVTVPVLRRVPLPATEPAFDDELGRAGGRPNRVPDTGRIVYLPTRTTVSAGHPSTRPAGPAAHPTSHPTARWPHPAGTGRLPGAPQPDARRSDTVGTGAQGTTGYGSAGVGAAAAAGPLPTQPAGTRAPADVAAPVRLRLVPAPDAPGPALRGPATRVPVPAARPVRSRPMAWNTADQPGDLGPGARLVVDSALTRSRLLGDDDAPARAAADALPDPRPMALQVAQAVVEVLAGDRQVSQLATWVDEEVYAAVAAVAPRTGPVAAGVRRAGPARISPADRPLVRSLHVTTPAAGVAEVSARVQIGARSRAVALRLEEWRGRWRCNALTVG